MELNGPYFTYCPIDVFWDNLTIESALLVRVYAEFCRGRDDDLQFEKAVPEVTRHAFYIQRYCNIMQEASEEKRPEAEFIVTQLLMIAKLLDYADENGRRKMFNLLRKSSFTINSCKLFDLDLSYSC